jgi:hypothetical protein
VRLSLDNDDFMKAMKLKVNNINNNNNVISNNINPNVNIIINGQQYSPNEINEDDINILNKQVFML